jgi:uncharacterized peroxidase-related enzyme
MPCNVQRFSQAPRSPNLTAMTRINPIDIETAAPDIQSQLAAVRALLGGVPNLFRVAARSPAALDALVGLFGAVGKGALPARTREAIALAVAQVDGCDYCLSAHTLLGKRAGLSEHDIAAARAGTGGGDAAVALAHALVEQRGHVTDAQVADARAAGLGDRELLEVVANVALNVLTNFINTLAQTPIDFPVVRR